MRMKKIQLTRGQVATVDDEDYKEQSKHKWHAMWNGTRFYACRKIGHRGPLLYMHREIMKPSDNEEVDHISPNSTLNNIKSNLRICSTPQNQWNTGPNKANKSGFRGVCWDKRKRKWRCSICVFPQRIFLGYFILAEDAAGVWNEAAIKFHGEFAFQNQV